MFSGIAVGESRSRNQVRRAALAERMPRQALAKGPPLLMNQR